MQIFVNILIDILRTLLHQISALDIRKYLAIKKWLATEQTEWTPANELAWDQLVEYILWCNCSVRCAGTIRCFKYYIWCNAQWSSCGWSGHSLCSSSICFWQSLSSPHTEASCRCSAASVMFAMALHEVELAQSFVEWLPHNSSAFNFNEHAPCFPALLLVVDDQFFIFSPPLMSFPQKILSQHCMFQ